MRIRRALRIDTSRVREKTIKRLEEIFNIASDYARGKVERVTDETGKQRPLSILERQYWARIAAYTAQIILNVTKGIDERQIDQDLANLEMLMREGKAKKEAESARADARGDDASATKPVS